MSSMSKFMRSLYFSNYNNSTTSTTNNKNWSKLSILFNNSNNNKNNYNNRKEKYDDGGKQKYNKKSLSYVGFGLATAIAMTAVSVALQQQKKQSQSLGQTIRDYFLGPASLMAKESEPNEQYIVITPRQRLFFQFASLEYEGIPYMTPQDFLESVTENHPRPRIRRKLLSKENYKSHLKSVPKLANGSPRLFRNLEEKGLISYSEYLFLLCVITKSKSHFQIAFNMFDTDGNNEVDKNEFLVLTKIFQRTNEGKGLTKAFESRKKDQDQLRNQQQNQEENNAPPSPSNQISSNTNHPTVNNLKQVRLMKSLTALTAELTDIDTTLSIHFFGQKGQGVLNFNQFRKFMEDLQREVLEIEFNEFSKGMNKISSVDFAEILLRYTNFDQEKKLQLLRKLHTKIDVYTRGITFDKFHEFSMFMNNLGDFGLALKYHTLANRSISVSEFQRAVKISCGRELDPQMVEVIFNVFDADGDGQLSYKEFIAVLKDRLKRGIKSKGSHLEAKNELFEGDNYYQNQKSTTTSNGDGYLAKYKACIRRKLRESKYD